MQVKHTLDVSFNISDGQMINKYLTNMNEKNI